jgi:hypothetical protein
MGDSQLDNTTALSNKIGGHGECYPNTSSHISHFVPLNAVTFQAAFLRKHWTHQSEKRRTLDGQEFNRFLHARFKSLQGLPFPRVCLVFGSQGLHTRDTPENLMELCKFFLHLPKHVGRIHQGQPFAGRKNDVSFRDMTEVEIGTRPFVYRDVHPTMRRGPETEGLILVEMGKGRLDGYFPGVPADRVDIENKGRPYGKHPHRDKHKGISTQPP